MKYGLKQINTINNKILKVISRCIGIYLVC